MKKDITILKVTDLAIAIVPDENIDDEFWHVYLINEKNTPISNVIINSTGYGEIEGEKVRTSTMRYYFEEIPPHTAIIIEPILKKLFTIANEYWVSFGWNGYLYDKKFIFVEGAIDTIHFTKVPLIDRKGVMIR